MKQTNDLLLSQAEYSHTAAELLRRAVIEECRFCVSEISDLNRLAITCLSDLERRLSTKEIPERAPLSLAYALAECTHLAFSAAMLLPDSLPHLPPLCDIVTAGEQLAREALKMITNKPSDCFSIHLTAHKARGAHAMLLMHYCAVDGGKRLLPLALALESHRNRLEQVCGLLLQWG